MAAEAARAASADSFLRPPCRKETPDLVRVAKRFVGKGLCVVGVSLDTGAGADSKVRDFARRYGVTYPLVLGQGHAAMITPSVELVQALPMTLLIDRRGRVAKMNPSLKYVPVLESSVFARYAARVSSCGVAFLVGVKGQKQGPDILEKGS